MLKKILFIVICSSTSLYSKHGIRYFVGCAAGIVVASKAMSQEQQQKVSDVATEAISGFQNGAKFLFERVKDIISNTSNLKPIDSDQAQKDADFTRAELSTR